MEEKENIEQAEEKKLSVEIKETPSVAHIRETILEQGETIIWQGAPNFNFGMTDVKNSVQRGGGRGVGGSLKGFWGGGGNIGGVASVLVQILIFPLVFFTAFFFSQGDTILGIITLLLGISLVLYPLVRQSKEKFETAYYVTSKRVIFELLEKNKKVFHSILLTEIPQIVMDVDDSERGTVYFQLDEPEFVTHDFQSGKPKHVPTFELVPEVRKVGQMIHDLIAKAKSEN